MNDWVVALAGAAVGAALGRWAERAKHNDELRSKAYADYLGAVAAAAHLRSDEDERDAMRAAADAKARIAVYGSSDVVDALARFEEAGGTLADDVAQAAFVSLVSAMRPKRDAVAGRSLSLLLLGRSR